MRLLRDSLLCTFVLLPGLFTVRTEAQAGTVAAPIVTTVCALAAHPAQYAGKVVEVRTVLEHGPYVVEWYAFDPSPAHCRGPAFREIYEDHSESCPDRRERRFENANPLQPAYDDGWQQVAYGLHASLWARDEDKTWPRARDRYTVEATMVARLDDAGAQAVKAKDAFGAVSDDRYRLRPQRFSEVKLTELPFNPKLLSRTRPDYPSDHVDHYDPRRNHTERTGSEPRCF